jgi:uncharacterized protein YndB with AHSA1/START domain
VTESGKRELTLSLPSDREIVMTRVFAAPRELVFRAWTDPELIPHWWGWRDTTTVATLDLRPGGAWRFVSSGPDGVEYAFRGEYREVVPPERLVYTFEFEGMPGHVLVETITLEERDGLTTLTNHSLYDSKEERDGMLESMEPGAAESMDRLEELLATMANRP